MCQAEHLRLSPFTTLLEAYVARRQNKRARQKIRTVLESVVKEKSLLAVDESWTSLDVIACSLQESRDWKAFSQLFRYLDNCILRLVRKPVHYHHVLMKLVSASGVSSRTCSTLVDPLLIIVLDQWSFMVKSADTQTIADISSWLLRYIDMTMRRIGYIDVQENGDSSRTFLSTICNQFKAQISDKGCHATFEMALTIPEDTGVSQELMAFRKAENQGRAMQSRISGCDVPRRYHETPISLKLGHVVEDHTGMNRWAREDVHDAIREGLIGKLVLHLCSRHVEIRKQALMNVHAFAKKLKVSACPA